MPLNKQQVFGHRANSRERLGQMLTAGIMIVEADIVRVAGTDRFFFAHPLDLRGRPGFNFLDDGTVVVEDDRIKKGEVVEGLPFLTLAEYRDILVKNPSLILLCEVKIAQQGPGLVEYYDGIRSQIGEEVMSRFIVVSFSRREIVAAQDAGFTVGIFTGDDPDDEGIERIIEELAPWIVLADQFRITVNLIQKMKNAGILTVPYVVNDAAMAEKLIGWGATAVLSDKVEELLS